MEENKIPDCQIHVMPPVISDDDIASLFAGVAGVMKRKYELDAQNELISINLNMERLSRQLKEKTAECVRLKNEIIRLKSLIKEE